MRKFRFGDRVKLVSQKWEDRPANPRWGGMCGKIEGIVEEVRPEGGPFLPIGVKWGNGQKNGYYVSDLELISREEIIYE